MLGVEGGLQMLEVRGKINIDVVPRLILLNRAFLSPTAAGEGMRMSGRLGAVC